MAKIERKQGDTITVSETFERPGSRSSQALDLSDAQSVKIYVDHPSSGDLVVNDTPEITDAANGMVEYTLDGTQTARQGNHRLEFVAEFAGGETFSYPQTGFVSLQVTDSAARELPTEDLAYGESSVSTLAAGDVNLSGTLTGLLLGDAADVAGNPLQNVGAVSETENVVADAGASYDIDLSNGGVHKITLTQDCDITLSGIDAAASNSATLIVEQDGTGGHSLTWSTWVLWPRGNPPSVTGGAGEIDRFAFTYIDGGWFGSEAGAGFASTIPDNTVAHYDASQLSLNDGDTVSVWPDEQGDNDLDIQTGSPTYVESGINGNPAIAFNGDGLEVTGLSVNQPNTTYVVFEYQSENFDEGRVLSGVSERQATAWAYSGTNEWRTYAGLPLSGSNDLGI